MNRRKGTRVGDRISPVPNTFSIGLAAVIGAALAAVIAVTVAALSASSTARAAEQAVGCQLNSPHGNVKHVIYIQFDNTHFLRDNANVPSDL